MAEEIKEGQQQQTGTNPQNTTTQDQGKDTRLPDDIQKIVNKSIEAARREEKEKLYPQIEKLKGDKETLEKKLAELQEEVKKLQELVTVTKKTEENTNKTTDEKMKDAVKNALTEAQKQFADAEASLIKRVADLEGTNKRLEIEKLRSRLIAEATADGSKLIEPLVRGESEADIQAAIAVAKAEWLKAFEAGKTGKVTAPPPAAPSPDVSGTVKVVDLDGYRNVTDPKKRKELREKMLVGLQEARK